MEELNLYEKIVKVMSDVSYLQKDDTVGSGNSQYKAISIEKVTIAIRDSLIQHKIVIVPIQQTRKESFMEYEKENTYKGTIEKKQRLMSEVDVTYRIINAEIPEEFIDVVSAGCGVDTQDKGIGKAMTYAYKNMLLRSFAIPTGEDADKTHNDVLENETTITKQQESKPNKPKQNKSEQPKPKSKQSTGEYTRELAIEAFKLLPDETQSEITAKYKSYNDMTDAQVKITYHKYCTK